MIQSSRHIFASLLLACGATISHTHADLAAAAAAAAAASGAAGAAPADDRAATTPHTEAIISAPEQQHLRLAAMQHASHERGDVHPALYQPVKRNDVDSHTVHTKVRARKPSSLDDVLASRHYSPTIPRPKPITGQSRAIPLEADESADRRWIAITRQLLSLESSDAAPSTLFDLPSSQPTYATHTPSFEPAPSIKPNDEESYTRLPSQSMPKSPTPRPLPLQPTLRPMQPDDSVGNPGDHQHSAAPTLHRDDDKPSASPDFAYVTTLPPSSDAWSSPVALESTPKYSPTYKPTMPHVDASYTHMDYKPTNPGNDDDLPNYAPTYAPSSFRSALVFPSSEDRAYWPTPNYASPVASDKPMTPIGAPSSLSSAPPVVSPPLPAAPPSRLPSSSSTATPTQCPQPTPEPSVQRALRMTTTPTQNFNTFPTSSSTSTPVQCPQPTPEPSLQRAQRVTTTPTQIADSLPTSSSTAAPTQCPKPSPEPSVQRAPRKTTQPTQNRNSLPTSSSTATPTQCPQPTPEPSMQRPVRMTTLPTQSPITTPTRIPTIQKPTRAPTSIPTKTTRVRPATQIPTAENTTTTATELPTLENSTNAEATRSPTTENSFKAPTLSMPTTEGNITSPTQKSPTANDPSDAPSNLPTADAMNTELPTSNSTTAPAVPLAQESGASSSTSSSSSLADNSAVIPVVLGIGGITAIFATMALNAMRNAAA